MKTLFTTFVIICMLIPILALPQTGNLDSTFSKDGKTLNFIRGVYDAGEAVAVRSDGKIIVAGGSSKDIYYKSDFGLMGYTADGLPDPGFGEFGRVVTDFGGDHDYGLSIIIQEDGKIIVAGRASNIAGTDFGLARYNIDGSPDSSFDNDGKVITDFGSSESAYATVLLPNGKILVVGISGNSLALARYKVNGKLDKSFGLNGKITTYLGNFANAYAAVIKPNGKIIVAGEIFNGSNNDFVLVQYLSNGIVDSSFGTNGKVITDLGSYEEAHSIALLPDGKILVAGFIYNGTDNDFALLRYRSNGKTDSSFGTNGLVTTDINGEDKGKTVIVQDNGKILVAGYSYYNFELVRYKSNGELDKTFGTNGIVITNFNNPKFSVCRLGGAAIQSDGKIVLAGSAVIELYPKSKIAVARYNGDASLSYSKISPLQKNETENESPSIKIYPNPIQSVLNIEFVNTKFSNKKISIYDIKGKLLLTKTATGNLQLDVHQLTAGAYVLRINDENGKQLYNGKVIKQ